MTAAEKIRSLIADEEKWLAYYRNRGLEHGASTVADRIECYRECLAIVEKAERK